MRSITVSKYYSIYVRVICDEYDLNGLPLPGERARRKLFMLIAHGIDAEHAAEYPTRGIAPGPYISLGYPQSYPEWDPYIFSMKDSEIAWLVDQFADDADIGLFTCHSHDMVDFVKENAGMRKVWGTTDEYCAPELDFSATFLEWDRVKFIVKIRHHGKDITCYR